MDPSLEIKVLLHVANSWPVSEKEMKDASFL